MAVDGGWRSGCGRGRGKVGPMGGTVKDLGPPLRLPRTATGGERGVLVGQTSLSEPLVFIDVEVQLGDVKDQSLIVDCRLMEATEFTYSDEAGLFCQIRKTEDYLCTI